MAYHCGAKYIVIFEYDIMSGDHFYALKRFWGYVKRYPERCGVCRGNVAYILPKNLGFGFRREDDIIWGIWRDVLNLVEKYGCRINIFYDEMKSQRLLKGYRQVFYWNQTFT